MKEFNKKKKKALTAFTLLLVPEDKGTVQSWRLPPWLARAAVMTVVVMIGGMAYFFYSYFSLHDRVQSLKYLEAIQERQEEEIRKLKEAAVKMQERVAEVGDLDQQIRKMVGLEEETRDQPPPSRGGSEGMLDKLRLMGRENVNRGSGELAEIRSTLEVLNEEIEANAKQLETLEKDVSERLEYLAAVPSGWPARGPISSKFGNRRSPFGSRTEFHNGLDIAASYGSTIVAAADGVVTFAGWKDYGFGRVVTIKHGYGFVTEYAHCSAVLVKPGEKVKRGEAIAKVGSSGRSTGPHLHFIVEKNGVVVDPLKYLE